MNIATIKHLSNQRLIAYISVFSVSLGIYTVYADMEDSLHEIIDWLNLIITGLLTLILLVGMIFDYQHSQARHTQLKNFKLAYLVKFIMIILAPNPWSSVYTNRILFITLNLRLYFAITYWVKATMYYQPRAARILSTYGVKPSLTFNFALRVILNDVSISTLIFIYIMIVLFYSHCLKVINPSMQFIDCFEVVVVTLPTIGYGDYQITGLPRLIILCVLVTGVALNAFVTLRILLNFQMTTGENNSYILMNKVKVVEDIQILSSHFIIRKIAKRDDLQQLKVARQRDQQFKTKYRQLKARYRTLNPEDSLYQFNYFNQSLGQLKIKMTQTNNMINCLLTKLTIDKLNSRNHNKKLKQV